MENTKDKMFLLFFLSSHINNLMHETAWKSNVYWICLLFFVLSIWFTKQTDTMEQCPSIEDNSQEYSRKFLLWNPKVCFLVHKSPPLEHIQVQMNPVLPI